MAASLLGFEAKEYFRASPESQGEHLKYNSINGEIRMRKKLWLLFLFNSEFRDLESCTLAC